MSVRGIHSRKVVKYIRLYKYSVFTVNAIFFKMSVSCICKEKM